MSRSRVVYLSGPIAGQTYEGAIGWREEVEIALTEIGIDVLSPMRGKSYLEGEGRLGTFVDTANQLSAPQMIYLRDRLDVERCDLMLVYLPVLDRVSIGTCIEIGWANAWGKPIIGVAEGGKNNIHYHPILNKCVTAWVDNLPEAAYLIGAVL